MSKLEIILRWVVSLCLLGGIVGYQLTHNADDQLTALTVQPALPYSSAGQADSEAASFEEANSNEASSEADDSETASSDEASSEAASSAEAGSETADSEAASAESSEEASSESTSSEAASSKAASSEAASTASSTAASSEAASTASSTAASSEAASSKAASSEAASTAPASSASSTAASVASAETAAPRGPYNDGVYSGSANGFGGRITVSVTIQNGYIAAVDVVSAEGEDKPYLRDALQVISYVVASQSTQQDAISGATSTTWGILDAIDSALKGAV